MVRYSLARSSEHKLLRKSNQIMQTWPYVLNNEATAGLNGQLACMLRACIISSNPSGALMEREEKTIFQEHLKRAGLKRTTPRALILDAFLDTEGHVSSEDLYSIIKAKDPSVGFTTVYRTLKLLKE